MALLMLGACSKSEHYPEKYIGFEKSSLALKFNKSEAEKEISLKLITAEKKDEDREVELSYLWDSQHRGNSNRWGKQRKAICKLTDKKVVIPARKKSVTVRLRVFPKLMEDKEVVRVVCSPKDKSLRPSQITLQLTTK